MCELIAYFNSVELLNCVARIFGSATVLILSPRQTPHFFNCCSSAKHTFLVKKSVVLA